MVDESSALIFKMISASLVLTAALFTGFALGIAKRQFAGVHTGDATVYDVGLGACGIFNASAAYAQSVTFQ